MKNKYVILNKVQTQLLTWGEPFDCNGKDVIICITGNPGVSEFYVDFASELHVYTGLPVCVIGHAGHAFVPDEKSNTLKGQEDLFNLEGQIQHKLDLINNYIDKQSKLHLIGHSIGAWMIMELLDNNKNLDVRVSSINLLFPTLQNMAETKNGIFLNKVLRNIHLFIMFLFYLVNFLPSLLVLCLIEQYFKWNLVPIHYSKAVLKFLHPKVGEKVLFLAYNEMDTVKKLNIRALENFKEKTNVIYSKHDGWAPVHYMKDLRKFQPQMRLKEVDDAHAFILKSSERIAEMVTQFIQIKM